MAARQCLTHPDDNLAPLLGQSGFAARPAQTVVEVFQDTVKRFGNLPAIHWKFVEPNQPHTDVAWSVWTWQEYYDQVKSFAKSLIHLGFQPHRVVNILGFNSPQWFVANCGAIMASGIAAGIYATNLPEACAYITRHSQAEVVVVDGNKQLAKYRNISREMTSLKALVVYGREPIDQAIANDCGVPVHSFDDFIRLGSNVPDEEINNRISHQLAGHCTTLIYTSGTTGPPKAVMISSDNITWATAALADIVSIRETDSIVSYLPLSHIAAQILDIHAPMCSGAAVYFAQQDALKGSLSVTLRNSRPTIFFGVPRVWEKIYEKMQELGRATTGIKKSISSWAKARGLEKLAMSQFGAGGGSPCGYGIAQFLVFGKVRAALGLDNARACFTGAAPIGIEVLQYFSSLDIPIYEVFGQSECTGPHTVNFSNAWKIGTCGRPIEGSESRISTDTGELQYCGRHIMMGYMYMEDKTRETIDADGWLLSGDKAEFDADNQTNVNGPSGFMRITGRIKELIKTAGGENIPPVLIEHECKLAMPAVSNCMLVGDRRKYLVMLFCLITEIDEAGNFTDRLAGEALNASRAIGSSATTVGQARDDALWTTYINGGVAKANKNATSDAQRIQKWTLLNEDFSEKGGELTPTLKLKRSVVAEKHARMIESLYEDDESKGGK